MTRPSAMAVGTGGCMLDHAMAGVDGVAMHDDDDGTCSSCDGGGDGDDHSYDATAALFGRGDMLRKLRELEREDEAERALGCESDGSLQSDTLVYDTFLADQRYYDDYKHVNYRCIDFGHVHGKPLVIEQDRKLGKGGLVWDAGFILADHIMRRGQWAQDTPSSVIELGAGTGVTGLLLARSFPDVRVELTDLAEVVPLVHKNCSQVENATASVLRWGEPVATRAGAYDVIVGSDVIASIYDPSGLAKTIYDLAHEKTMVYLACRDRLAGSVEAFEERMRGMFHHVERTRADSRNGNPSVWVLQIHGKRRTQ